MQLVLSISRDNCNFGILSFLDNKIKLVLEFLNYLEMWFPNWRMNIVVSSIVEMFMNKIAL